MVRCLKCIGDWQRSVWWFDVIKVEVPLRIKSIYFGLCCSLKLFIVAVFRNSWLRYLGLAGSLCWKPFRCRLGLFGIFFVCQLPEHRRPGYFRFRLCSIWTLSICPKFLMTGLVCVSIRWVELWWFVICFFFRLNCRQLYRLLVRNSVRFCNWYFLWGHFEFKFLSSSDGIQSSLCKSTVNAID